MQRRGKRFADRTKRVEVATGAVAYNYRPTAMQIPTDASRNSVSKVD